MKRASPTLAPQRASTLARVGAALVLAIVFVIPVSQGQGAGERPPTAVRGDLVKQENLQNHKRVTGSLRAMSISQVAAQISGRIEAVNVREGATVKAGDTLARLDTRRAIARIAVLRAQQGVQNSLLAVRNAELKSAEADLAAYQRAKEAQPGAVSDQVIRDAQTRVDVAKAQLGTVDAEVARLEAEVLLEQLNITDAVITAPFDGVVLARMAEVGQWVNSVGGAALFHLQSIGDMEALLDVDEGIPMDLVRGVSGLSIEVTAIGESVTTTSHVIMPDVDPRSRRYRVIARVPADPRLAPGMSITAELPTTGMADRITISSDALRRDAGGYQVMKAQPAGPGVYMAMPTRVSVDFRVGNRVVVTSQGLSANDVVVTEGNVRLMPMTKITLNNAAELGVGAPPAGNAGPANAGKQGGGE